jgi:hypothetical protein
MQYILFNIHGGWQTNGGARHSDYRQAAIFDEAEALDMCKLHTGRLVPVDRALYERAIGGPSK